MSAGYAQRLSEYPNKGICGLPENYDTKRALAYKLDKLVQLLQSSRHTVVLTGAGISTSAGIPDFRGPFGIWTKEMQEGRSKKKKQPNNNLMSRNKLLLAERNMKNNCSDSEANTLTNTITNTNGRKRRQDGDNRDDGDCSNGTQATATTITPTLPENQQPNAVISFETALPTYTHWALAHMLLHPIPSLPRNVTDDAVVFDDDDDEVTIFTAKCNRKGVGATTATTNSAASATSVTTQCFPSPVQYIVTQNVDGLHRKTNIPRDKMSILHGCIFTEVCDTCHTEYIRNYEIQSIGLNYTGRNCTLGRGDNGEESSSPCPGKLKDTLLDWEDDLPELDWNRAKSECQRADLILCLGTSLRIEPAASLCTFPNSNYQQPRRRRKKEKNTTTKSKNDDQDNDDDENQQQQLQLQQQPPLGYVIVNLQPTPYDDGAALVIRAKVDDVMREVMDKLGYGDENGWKSRKSF